MKRLFGIDSPFVSAAIKVFDCICLSVLWAVFSLPVITAGASSAALYSAVYNYIRKDRGKLWNTFWSAFKENLKRSTLLWLIALVIMSLLTADVIVFRSMKIKGDPLGNIYWVMLVIYCIALTWLIYLSAYSAKFNGSIKDVLKFSFVLMVIHPIRSLGVFLPVVCGAVVALTVPGLIIILPAGIFWACSFTLEKVFMLHMRQEDIDKINALEGDGNG